MRKLWLIFWFLFGFTFALTGGVVWWALNPSSSYMTVQGIRVFKDDRGVWMVNSARQLLQGDVTANWRINIQVLRTEVSYACENSGTSDYLVESGTVVEYELGPWSHRCLDAGPPVTLTFTRSILLWGFLPLRPVQYQLTLGTEEGAQDPTVNISP